MVSAPGPSTGSRPLTMVGGNAEIPPARGSVLAQRHPIPARRLAIQRRLECQERRPKVLARPAIAETRAFAEGVEHPIANPGPIEPDGIGLPLGTFHPRPGAAAVDLHAHPACLKILLAPLAVAALEVRGAAFVQRDRLVGGWGARTAATPTAPPVRRSLFFCFSHAIKVVLSFKIFRRARPCLWTEPGRSLSFQPLWGLPDTGKARGATRALTSEPARPPDNSHLPNLAASGARSDQSLLDFGGMQNLDCNNHLPGRSVAAFGGRQGADFAKWSRVSRS